MADNIWENAGGGGGDANDGTNWSLGHVPTAGEVMLFDSTAGGSATNDNCIFSGNISCDEINVTLNYSGDIDMNGFNLTTAIGGSPVGNMTFDGIGIFDCGVESGTETLTCGGDFDNNSQGTWIRGTSTVVMSGGGDMITSTFRDLFSLTINEDVTLTKNLELYGDFVIAANKTFTMSGGDLDIIASGRSTTINGNLSISAGREFWSGLSGSVTLGANGQISGDGLYIAHGSTVVNNNLAADSWLVAATRFSSVSSISNGQYGGTFLIRKQVAGLKITTFGTAGGAAETTFLGDVTFDSDKADEWRLAFNTNNPDVTFKGNVTLVESVGTINWVKGTGTVTFDGTTTFDDGTAAGANLGDVIVSDGNSLALADNMECDEFTGEKNSIISEDAFGPHLMTVNTSFLLDGISGQRVTWNDVDLDVSDLTPIAKFADITDSDAGPPGEEIDATNNCTDTGANPNWDFGVAAFGGTNIILGGGILA